MIPAPGLTHHPAVTSNKAMLSKGEFHKIG
jgi:hypothetical protein